MLRTLLICAAVLLGVGCDKSDESLYDLAGDWERITDAECVGDLEEDFLTGNRFTIFSDPSGMTIEQVGEALVLDFHGGPRADAILDGDNILYMGELPAGWITGCDGCLHYELSVTFSFTVLDRGRTIEIREVYETNLHRATCTNEWESVHAPRLTESNDMTSISST